MVEHPSLAPQPACVCALQPAKHWPVPSVNSMQKLQPGPTVSKSHASAQPGGPHGPPAGETSVELKMQMLPSVGSSKQTMPFGHVVVHVCVQNAEPPTSAQRLSSQSPLTLHDDPTRPGAGYSC